jgi:hypothetical protein
MKINIFLQLLILLGLIFSSVEAGKTKSQNGVPISVLGKIAKIGGPDG